MDRSRRTSDGIRVWSAQPDRLSAVPVERAVLTGRRVHHDHADKDRVREQPSDGRFPPPGRRAPARSRSVLPAPRRPSVRSASGRSLLVGGAIVAVVVIVVGVALVTSARTPTPADTAAAVPESVVSGAPSAPSVAGSSAPVRAVPSTPAGAPSSGRSSSEAPRSSVPGAVGPGSSATAVTRPSSTVPAALDPGRVWGYRSVQVITAVEGGGNQIRIGDRFESLLRCENGACRPVQGTSPFAFAPAVARYANTSVRVDEMFGADSPCMPITATVSITRQSDGSYRGTGSSVPRATRGSAGTKFCSYPSSSVSTVLTPVLLPVLDTAAGSGPVTLDPARITGYTGSRVVAGTRAPVTVTCDRGLCILTCPLSGCPGPVLFTAATATASSGPVTLAGTCAAGRGTVALTRDATGGYVVRATVQGAPAGCPSTVEFRLTPVTG